jgi:hypothetical protein
MQKALDLIEAGSLPHRHSHACFMVDEASAAEVELSSLVYQRQAASIDAGGAEHLRNHPWLDALVASEKRDKESAGLGTTASLDKRQEGRAALGAGEQQEASRERSSCSTPEGAAPQGGEPPRAEPGKSSWISGPILLAIGLLALLAVALAWPRVPTREAINELGVHEAGKGVAQAYSEAVRLFRKAADMGDANAIINLGTMYANGRGVAQDGAEAMRLYRKAADMGHEGAKKRLNEINALQARKRLQK